MADLPRRCRRDRRIGGLPKKAYRTEADARDSGQVGPGKVVYQCKHCYNYHIGRPKKET